MPHTVHRFQRGMHDLIHDFERYMLRQRNRANQRNRFGKHAAICSTVTGLRSDHARSQT
jgi:hypothetical protein